MSRVQEQDISTLVGKTITHVERCDDHGGAYVLWLGSDLRLYCDDPAAYLMIADAFTPPDIFSRKV